MRRRVLGQKDKTLFEKRFFPAGNYTWIVPPGCTEVDVFLVGGGASGSAAGGGGGYTKTFKKAVTGWRDGSAVSVTPRQSIPIVVGKGGAEVFQGVSNVPGLPGTYSQFLNNTYRANGGAGAQPYEGGAGGSAGAFHWDGASVINVGSDGSNSTGHNKIAHGQGHTTRDFGDATGKRNAGGGGGDTAGPSNPGGISDYVEGSGGRSNISTGGGGYGGGGAGCRYANTVSGKGGDGTVLIRYWAYSET